MNTTRILLLLVLTPLVTMGSELVVVESSSSRYELRQIVSDTDNITLEEGSEVLLITEDGRTIALSGPYDDLVNATVPSRGFEVFKALARLIGISEVDSRDLGGVRGDDDEVRVIDNRKTPWLFHAGLSGDQCLPENHEPVAFWREDSSLEQRLTVRHIASGDNASIVWKQGENTVAWPDQLAMQPNSVYVLDWNGQIRPVGMVIRQVPATVTEIGEATVAWLAARGCTNQAQLTLAALP
jgi:hypothetical protein